MLIIIKRSLPEKKDRQTLRSRHTLSSAGRSGAEQSLAGRHCLSHKGLEPPPLVPQTETSSALIPLASSSTTPIRVNHVWVLCLSNLYDLQQASAGCPWKETAVCSTAHTELMKYPMAKNRIWFVICRCYLGTSEILMIKVRQIKVKKKNVLSV